VPDPIVRNELLSQAENERRLDEIIHVHESSRRTYRSRKVAKALKRKGVHCSQNRIARIMKDNDMHSVRKRKYKATTNSKHNLPVAENLLADQKHSIETPHQAVVADITYVPTDEGRLYLASVLDFHSKHLEGWAIGD
jgi:putative transposase